MIAHYQPLLWDTQILGITTGRILPSVHDKETLQECLRQARKNRIQLLYWAVAQEESPLMALATEITATLTDHKVTYVREIPKTLKNDLLWEEMTCYIHYPAEQSLLELAYASGEYSRFRRDPHLTESQFTKIYTQWINNSIRREIADAVLVIYRQNLLAGMITVGKKNGRGDIGLLAVSKHARQQGIGKLLIEAAFWHFQQQGLHEVQVVTQQENLPACGLYTHCGFHVEKVEYFYHVWL